MALFKKHLIRCLETEKRGKVSATHIIEDVIMLASKNEFYEKIKSYVDEIHTDVIGNVIAHRQGTGPRIMFVAHHDVVRLMVSYIDENGFLYVKPAGAIEVSILPARKVVIMHEGKLIAGIIGKKPIHLKNMEKNGIIGYEDVWIDIGAMNRTDAEIMVSKGDYVYYNFDYDELQNDIIAGAYFDDRLGVGVLLELAEQLCSVETPWDVYYVASNYEEIGLRGAAVVANRIKPDVCVCVDVTHATDYPTTNPIIDGDVKIGNGCVISQGPNIYPELLKKLKGIAIKYDIPFQMEVSPSPTGTDANVVQISGEGVKTAVVSIPCRYMHTPYEVCSKKDVTSVITLLKTFVSYAF